MGYKGGFALDNTLGKSQQKTGLNNLKSPLGGTGQSSGVNSATNKGITRPEVKNEPRVIAAPGTEAIHAQLDFNT